MKLQKNISFQGRIKNPVNSKDKLVRFSINHLKHNVGGRNVEHEVVLNNKGNYLMVFTKLFPNKSTNNINDVNYSFGTMKRLDLVSKDKITEQAKVLTNWVRRINSY